MNSVRSSWNEVYERRGLARYPNEEFVRFFFKEMVRENSRPAGGTRMLDLGCGQGANLWFLKREGMEAVGLDISDLALEKCRERFREEAFAPPSLVQADFSGLPFRGDQFDLVFETSSLQHHTLANVRAIIGEMHRVLKVGGKLFSFCIGVGTNSQGVGQELEKNTHTLRSVVKNQYTGAIHYFSVQELRDLFGSFSEISVDRYERSEENNTHVIRYYMVRAIKKTGGPQI